MTFPADSARFTEILEATLRDLVRTGERLSNDNETKAFDLLEERFRATGAEVKRETVPLFVSTVPHAHLEVNGETLRAQGNAMTAPVTTGARGSRRFRVTGKPVPWTDDIKAPEEPAVAVVTGLANLGILRRAERLGFAGVLFVTGERIHRMIVSDVWGSPVPGVEDRYVSIPNASIDNATAERLGNGPVTLEIETESRWIASPVLTATLPGTESDRYAFLTGHIDSWGAGAIDNASGLAASTAILDTLAETPHPYGLKVVVWSGHSHGRYAGSTAWCDRHASELARSAFLHVNLDCLGMAGSTLYGFAPAMPSTEGLARRALALPEGETVRFTRFNRSCDQSFLALGIPSVFSNVSLVPPDPKLAVAGLAGGYGDRWHSDDDTEEGIDRAFLLRDALAGLRAVTEALERGPEALSAAAEWRDFSSRTLKAVHDAMKKLSATNEGMLYCRADVWGTYIDLLIETEMRLQGLTDDEADAFLRRLIAVSYTSDDAGRYDPAGIDAVTPFEREVKAFVGEAEFSHARATALLRSLNSLERKIARLLP